jgi:hypothetical protein
MEMAIEPKTKRGLCYPQDPLMIEIFLVPEVGIEPTRVIHPLDFESSASTSFTTPAGWAYTREAPGGCQYHIDRLRRALLKSSEWGCSSAGRAHDWQS